MAGRSSRSPAGAQSTSPISSPPRIEDVLNMHGLPNPSPRAQRVPYNPPNHHLARRSLYAPLPQHGNSSRTVPHSEGVIGNEFGASRNSPIMPSTTSSRSTSRAASSSFVPRVVRGTIAPEREAASASSSNGAPAGSRASLSPARTRRPSNTVAAVQGTPRSAPAPVASSTTIPPPSHVMSFPRPSYLDHCALRYYIQSDNTPDVPPDRYRFDSLHSSTTSGPTSHPRDVSSPLRDMDSDEESSASTGERERTVPPTRLPQRKPVDAIMQLPTRWSDQDRCPSLSVSPDGRDLTFHGPNQGEKEAAAARTNHPAPAACGIYYYEIEIINKGQKGHISIGFGTGTVRLSRLPGWEGQSWGYHGDDGNSFASEREGSQYGPKFTTGDTVGCGIDYSNGRAFFTKNGRYLGPVFEGLGSVGDMYPSVGLRTPNEAIRANFGHEPFVFDIDSHVEQERNNTWARIQNTTVAWTPPGTFAVNSVPQAQAGDEPVMELGKPVNDLILAYLTHHGYAKTARAFKAQSDGRSASEPAPTIPSSVDDSAMETDADVTSAPTYSGPPPDAAAVSMQDDTQRRQRIVHAIVDGDMDLALEETRTHYPRVLEREEGLVKFKLRCRKFVELVLDAAAALRKVREEEARGKGKDVVGNGVVSLTHDGESMDVDEDNTTALLNGNTSHLIASKTTKAKPSVPSPLMGMYQLALTNALAFGQSLQADYKTDARPDVQAIFKRTLSLVAYDDPLADDPSVPEAVKEMAGQAAREHLAEEINRAILESQGRPPHPALERLYRQTQACIMQLGWLGVGSAAFADMPKEFLDA